MEKEIILYHGSEKIIENPVFGAGKKNNDFGLGFYCTQSNDLAKEWAVSSLNDGLFSIKTPVARRAKQYLIDHFSINVNAYDLIIGYRADDSYFDYAESFLNNTISVEQLAQAMRLGKLGEQIVIKSQFAFSNLKFEGYETADKNQYYDFRKVRNDEANQYYLKMLDQEMDGLFIQDIIRGGIKNDDPRIPRNLSE